MNRLSRYSFAMLLALWAFTGCEEPPDTLTFGQVSGLVLDEIAELPVSGTVVEALQNQVADTTDGLGAFLLDSLGL